IKAAELIARVEYSMAFTKKSLAAIGFKRVMSERLHLGIYTPKRSDQFALVKRFTTQPKDHDGHQGGWPHFHVYDFLDIIQIAKIHFWYSAPLA
ncbi:MAG: hypothetical protein RR893_12555, partial [Clostridia bacterium]